MLRLGKIGFSKDFKIELKTEKMCSDFWISYLGVLNFLRISVQDSQLGHSASPLCFSHHVELIHTAR